MRLHVMSTAEEGSRISADLVAREIEANPATVLGVATGSTPLGTWTELAGRGLDLSRVSAFALDEYVGLEVGHPQSYRAVIDREIVGPLGLNRSRVRVPDGGASDPAAAAVAFEHDLVDAGGVDIQILGIGRNGHIAFNEPGSPFSSVTRVERLSPTTRADNARFFESASEVPERCITQGIGTILRARRVVLLAFGEAKADALCRALDDDPDPSCPASALQLHGDVEVIADEAAAALLSRNRG